MSIRLFTRGRFSESNAHSMRIGSVHIVSDNLRTESHRIQCALSQSTSRCGLEANPKWISIKGVGEPGSHTTILKMDGGYTAETSANERSWVAP